MLKVAILSPSAELGGAERSLLGFLGAAGGRMEPTVFLPREGPLCAELERLGVPCQVVPQPRALSCQSRELRAESAIRVLEIPFQAPVYLARLAVSIRRSRPHLLYTNGIKAHLLSVALRPFLRLPTVWHVRDHWGGRMASHLADAAADLVVANSRATAQRIGAFMRAPEKVMVVHNGVDVQEFNPEGPVADVGPDAEGAPRVGLVGALARLKGHELLLEAVERLVPGFPSLKCFFIGGAIYDTARDRGYEDELRRSVRRRGLERSVVFVGFQERVAPWYRAMDVVVNASVRPEGFGRTLLEAMACGRPVVGPDAGGVPEFVRHGENGLLYEMGNAEALAVALRRLLADPGLRRSLGAAGRETAVRRFAAEPHARALLEALVRVARRGTAVYPASSPPHV